MKDYIRTAYYPFQNEQLKELTHQIDMYVQLLYQFLLFQRTKTPTQYALDMESTNAQSSSKKPSSSLAQAATQDPNKYRAYCLLYEFQSKKEQTMKPLNLP